MTSKTQQRRGGTHPLHSSSHSTYISIDEGGGVRRTTLTAPLRLADENDPVVELPTRVIRPPNSRSPSPSGYGSPSKRKSILKSVSMVTHSEAAHPQAFIQYAVYPSWWGHKEHSPSFPQQQLSGTVRTKSTTRKQKSPKKSTRSHRRVSFNATSSAGQNEFSDSFQRESRSCLLPETQLGGRTKTKCVSVGVGPDTRANKLESARIVNSGTKWPRHSENSTQSVRDREGRGRTLVRTHTVDRATETDEEGGYDSGYLRSVKLSSMRSDSFKEDDPSSSNNDGSASSSSSYDSDFSDVDGVPAVTAFNGWVRVEEPTISMWKFPRTMVDESIQVNFPYTQALGNFEPNRSHNSVKSASITSNSSQLFATRELSPSKPITAKSQVSSQAYATTTETGSTKFDTSTRPSKTAPASENFIIPIHDNHNLMDKHIIADRRPSAQLKSRHTKKSSIGQKGSYKNHGLKIGGVDAQHGRKERSPETHPPRVLDLVYTFLKDDCVMGALDLSVLDD
ncbi:hypothetical protein BJ741DRAFT_589682 [Chytriomyces cf. hyalinus JEL632]|nr:hypothetical protein BJ741DRAFT_589682 [Chytriomyces cf. hyalinus JEL632]